MTSCRDKYSKYALSPIKIHNHQLTTFIDFSCICRHILTSARTAPLNICYNAENSILYYLPLCSTHCTSLYIPVIALILQERRQNTAFHCTSVHATMIDLNNLSWRTNRFQDKPIVWKPFIKKKVQKHKWISEQIKINNKKIMDFNSFFQNRNNWIIDTTKPAND